MGPLAWGPWPEGPGMGALEGLGGTEQRMDVRTHRQMDKISPVFYRTLSFWGRCPKKGLYTVDTRRVGPRYVFSIEEIVFNDAL